ncbi:hypothetical protein [Parafilimonas terrae]|uniref:Uncharacterized protein n=1 Tax=Parafilimonas terrae TaxID=1465490 RepID=A0A1I5XEG7_9BACT|nr:hypothetical protein [Parafilimonas terrae]SFQ30351.1 hypothetical protein SAMN05444277_108129 [Parafilimonas terrae]
MKFSLKRKKTKKVHPGLLPGITQIAFAHLQTKWAKWMTKRTQRFSRNTWKLLLALFVLTAGGYSIYLAIDAFISKGSKSIAVTPIRTPAHINETGDVVTSTPQVTDTGYNRIKNFRMYMDSLARSPSGKPIYDSIMKHRPGLPDSVRIIENYYQQLKQK